MSEMTNDSHRRPTSTADAFIHGLMAIVAGIRHEARIRSEIAKASALDDHILADIAVPRREIKRAVRGRASKLEQMARD